MSGQEWQRTETTAPLVETAWLAARLGARDLAIVDASVAKREDPSGSPRWFADREAFEEGRIPGARFADLVSAFSDPDAPLAFTRPSAGRFAAAAGALGLTSDQHIVVYDNATGIWAARLWWLLRAAGHRKASVLNGGLTAWRAEGRALDRGAPAIEPTTFVAREQDGFFVGKDDVRAIVEGRSRGRLVCVLRQPVFAGLERRYARPGHIPSSVNFPYVELIGEDNRFLPPGVLRDRLAFLLEGGQRLILYCGGGVTAAGTALALTLLGATDVAIYDGSLSEWSADPALPMARAALETTLR